MMRDKIMIGAVIAALVLGGGWLWSSIRAAEARGAAQEMARQSDSTWSAVLDSVETTWAARDRASAARNQALEAELDSIKGRMALADAEVSEAKDDAQRALRRLARRDSVTAAQIRELIALQDQANEECKDGLETCEASADSLENDVEDLQGRISVLFATNQQQAATIERIQSAPPVRGGMSLREILAWVLAGAATVFAISR